MRAAAAVAAVTPGTTVTATPAHRPDPFSLWSSSTTALAMAKMPGSPDETMTTSRPSAARSSANAARAASWRLGNECDVWCSPIGPDLAQIGTVSDQVGGLGQAGGGFGCAPGVISRPESDHGQSTPARIAHRVGAKLLGITTMEKYGALAGSTRSKGMTRSPAMVARSTYQARSSRPARITA